MYDAVRVSRGNDYLPRLMGGGGGGGGVEARKRRLRGSGKETQF